MDHKCNQGDKIATAYHSVTELERSNLCRTKYLLQNYLRYQALCPARLELTVSKAVLEILSFYLADHEQYTKRDFELIERCGPLLAPATLDAVEEIRLFPVEVASNIYPVLYHQYFNPEGTAINSKQLISRLEQEDMCLSTDELQILLQDGERMMSTLLFPNKFVAAMRACS